MTKILARSGGEGAAAAKRALVLGCLLLMGDALAKPTTVTLCLEELAWWWKRTVPFSCH